MIGIRGTRWVRQRTVGANAVVGFDHCRKNSKKKTGSATNFVVKKDLPGTSDYLGAKDGPKQRNRKHQLMFAQSVHQKYIKDRDSYSVICMNISL